MIAPARYRADTLDRQTNWQAGLREQFPIIASHPHLAFLDSAATSQKPGAVLDAVCRHLERANANVARGSYPWANQTTELLDRTRDQIKRFIDDPAPQRSAIHYVSGTTEGLRRIALEWLPELIEDGDEIIVPHEDHQANLLPWLEAREALRQRGRELVIRELPYDPASGDYDHRALPAAVNARTRFVAATHVHHVYGGNMNVHRIRDVVGPDVPICLDAAQSFGHLPISVRDLDVDFVVFSGHKTLALPGTGAVWARNQRGPIFTPAGWSGTPNISGIVSLQAALDWLDAAGVDRIEEWTVALANRLTDALVRLPSISILGCQQSLTADSQVQRRNGIVTFRHDRIDAGDIGFILADRGIMVRADHHCQGGRHPEETAVRVSLHVYNTPGEIDRLIDVIQALAS